MVIERSDAGQSYPPLPIRESRKENSALPAINLQMEQMNRQLTQLIFHLQKISQQIQIFQEEKNLSSLDSFQITKENNPKNHKYLTTRYSSTKMSKKILKRRKKLSNFINGVFIFFLVIGVAAALFSAIILFFRGPAMI